MDNILRGVLEDTAWSFLTRMMQTKGFYLQGKREGDKFSATLTTPGHVVILSGKIVPKSEAELEDQDATTV